MSESALSRPKRPKKVKPIKEKYIKPRAYPTVFNCKQCGNEFESRKACKSRTPKYCSMKCRGLAYRLNKKCERCGELIPTNGKTYLANRKFCGNKCKADSRRGTTFSPEWRKALSEGRKRSDKCKGSNLYNWKGGHKNTLYRTKVNGLKRRGLTPPDMEYLKFLLICQRNKCFYCDSPMKGHRNRTIEHLQPVTKGGTNHWYNLVYSCRSCNSKKHDKTLFEFSLKTMRLEWMANEVQLAARSYQIKYGSADKFIKAILEHRANSRASKES